MKRAFDRKFGPEFIAALPTSPGVYFIYGESGNEPIYIGKAKNLRRRLSQYRNAKRRKKHAKMKAIVADATRIEYQLCPSDLDACLLETELIQKHRPRWNVEGAFYFLYPMIGIRKTADEISFCYTTEPDLLPDYQFHGAYRSRYLTREAFFACMDLLTYLSHRRTPARGKRVPHSYQYSFRQLSPEWANDLHKFLSGAEKTVLEKLVLALVENSTARRRPAAIQEALQHLARFWRHEAKSLARARKSVGIEIYPIPQRHRDLLFLRARFSALQSVVPSRIPSLERKS